MGNNFKNYIIRVIEREEKLLSVGEGGFLLYNKKEDGAV